MNNTKVEKWKAIKGFEGIYEVSDRGKVRSMDRNNQKGRVLKQNLNNIGYYHVSLSKNGISKSHKLHRLVAQSFIPNNENKPQVNHIDGNKMNNTVENLEWVTPSENTRHAFKTGLNRNKGENCHLSKLSEKNVI